MLYIDNKGRALPSRDRKFKRFAVEFVVRLPSHLVASLDRRRLPVSGFRASFGGYS
jgi:hypothetical protein